MTFRSIARNVIERLTRCDIELHGGRTVAFIDRRRQAAAWFSQRSQIKSIIERYSIDLVIDVGANKGQFARGLRPYFGGEIISFEPVSQVFKTLESAAATDPKWQVCNVALGSSAGERQIHVTSQSDFSSFLAANKYGAERFGDRTSPVRKETISVRRLDAILGDIIHDYRSRNIFLKMDTQGFDSEVFLGAEGILDHVWAIQSEVSLIPIYEGMVHWTESISLYERHGFAIAGMFPITGDASRRVIEYDCLLTKLSA